MTALPTTSAAVRRLTKRMTMVQSVDDAAWESALQAGLDSSVRVNLDAVRTIGYGTWRVYRYAVADQLVTVASRWRGPTWISCDCGDGGICAHMALGRNAAEPGWLTQIRFKRERAVMA